MKKFIVFLLFSSIISLASGQKTQYPSAPQVVAIEEPPETTWTTKPILIKNQDLRRHAAILNASREDQTLKLTPSVQEVTAVKPKIKSKQESESLIFKQDYRAKGAKHLLFWKIRKGHLDGLLQKLFNGGENKTPKSWSHPIQK